MQIRRIVQLNSRLLVLLLIAAFRSPAVIDVLVRIASCLQGQAYPTCWHKTKAFLAHSLCLQLQNKHRKTTESKYSTQATYPVRYGGAVITSQQRPRYKASAEYKAPAGRLAVKLL
jgi:hypothetical protein